MNVFISWGGKDSLSHRTALLLKDWLPKVMQQVTCFVSSQDIEPGARWANELFVQLEKCDVGILCLTPECVSRPWLLFEAGALAKRVENSRVCPLFIGIQGQLDYPLGAFQGKNLDKEGVKSLVQMVNTAQREHALRESALDDAFEVRWPQFIKDFESLPSGSGIENRKEPESNEQKALNELLETIRGIASGRIKVNTVTRGEAFNILATSEDNYLNSFSPDAEEKEIGRKMLSRLVSELSRQRPLITAWVGSCKLPFFSEGVLSLLLDDNQAMIASTLNKPTNKKLMLSIMQEAFPQYEVKEVRVSVLLL